MGKFEQSWREAFEGAEISPVDSVWTNIDKILTDGEHAAMRRRIVLYQRVAAASILFALLVGSFGIFQWKKQSRQLAQGKQKNEAPASQLPHDEDTAKTSAHLQNDTLTEASRHLRGVRRLNPTKSQTPQTTRKISTTQANLANASPYLHDEELAQASKHLQDETLTNSSRNPQGVRRVNPIGELELLPIPEIKDGPVITEIYRKLPAISGAFLARKEDNVFHEQYWTSVTASTGSFGNAPGNSGQNMSYYAAQSPFASNPSMGSSYSVGMLGGMRLSNRVVLQSGIQYMNQSAGATSNIAAPVSLAAVANSISVKNPTAFSVSTPYSITSSNEFISVPVQAGYLLVDRKMGLQVNTGVSTDFFLRNTLADPSGQRQSYSQGPGLNSPYRSVDFAGLASTELSYKLGARYRLSVVPGLRYSFNSILKSNSTPLVSPVIWDVGFRFRYIIK